MHGTAHKDQDGHLKEICWMGDHEARLNGGRLMTLIFLDTQDMQCMAEAARGSRLYMLVSREEAGIIIPRTGDAWSLGMDQGIDTHAPQDRHARLAKAGMLRVMLAGLLAETRDNDQNNPEIAA